MKKGLRLKNFSLKATMFFYDPKSEVVYKFISDKKGKITKLQFFDAPWRFVNETD